MKEYPYADDIWPEAASSIRRSGEWRFSLKDTVIITSMALAMSGLIGLGAIILVELIDSFLY